MLEWKAMTKIILKTLSLTFILSLYSCAQTKEAYVDSRYELCMKRCSIAYKNKPVDLATCKAGCVKDKVTEEVP